MSLLFEMLMILLTISKITSQAVCELKHFVLPPYLKSAKTKNGLNFSCCQKVKIAKGRVELKRGFVILHYINLFLFAGPFPCKAINKVEWKAAKG